MNISELYIHFHSIVNGYFDNSRQLLYNCHKKNRVGELKCPKNKIEKKKF